ncbi:hypothetical protein VTN02DRAFT_204 [Thermoascus thermophilus]
MEINLKGMPWVVPVRVVQAVFALIVLALTAYVISWSGDGGSSDAVNFMLFNGVWTLFIATPYLALAPVFFPNITNQFIILLAEALTMIFWFAGFIALAALLPGPGWCSKFGPCRALEAATVFGAFAWALFAATTGVVVANLIRSGGRAKQQSSA